MNRDIGAIEAKVKELSAFVEPLREEIGRVIVGQRHMVETMMLAFLCRGHILLEGVPGLAKTTAVKAVADAINTGFQRLQFTPDLLPADIVGTMIYNQHEGSFETKKGPIFSNIILADEINRAPAKVQSALLEAMQERQVTIGTTTYPLDDPFLVMATQNPIEQEGTYPLPEAQVDRFMFKIVVGYPTKKEEREIVRRMTAPSLPKVNAVLEIDKLFEAREVVREIFVDEGVQEYILDLVFATRDPGAYGLGDLSDLIDFGASPRASIYLTEAAKGMAFLRHRGFVTPDDVKMVGMDVLRHRILLTYEAEAEEITTEDVVRKIFDSVDVP